MSAKPTTDTMILDRRSFLGGAAAAVLMPVTLGFAAGQADAGATVGAYIRIDASNTVTLITGQTEMGQGIGSGLAQIMAEELMLDWAQVRFEHAPVNPALYGLPGWGLQLTGGSTSTMMWYAPLRSASAIAAWRLRAAAALTFGGAVEQWTLAGGGKVNHAIYGVKTFASVLGKVASTPVPASAPFAGTKRIVGQRVRRIDLAAKVDGSAKFGMDVMLPGMVFASVAHSPTLTGTVKSCPAKASGALAVVNLGNAVGVVASNTWNAMRIASSLQSKVTWALPANRALLDSGSLASAAQALQAAAAPANLKVFETVGSPDGKTGAIDATYVAPFLAHACMEVMNATVSVTKTNGLVTLVELWLPTQGQSFVPGTVRSVPGLANLTDAQIKVNSMLCGGGFGRKIEQDYVLQAVKLAIAVGKPVKLTWSRPQDFKNDKYRPYASMRVRLGGDANGIGGLVYRNVSASISFQQGANPEDTGAVAGAVKLPYGIANRRIEFAPLPTAIPLGYWRSVGESYNTFAIESAIDELALALNQDPIDYRLRMLGADQRAARVLQTLKASLRYTGMAAARRGVAFLKGFNSYVALALEIALDNVSRIRVTKAHYVIDCGLVINPDAVEAQMQGGLVHGLYSALYNRVTFANGVPQVQNFSNYRVLTARDMPQVTVDILEGDPATTMPGGVGETGVPCVAPALANAYHRLSGTRVRELPFYPGATMSED
ncbi:molybdopterin cofactor-binding domain-containing protein [Aestuariivirga sp.]|uniref:xanthine dehydrogenase family protein molybdopterin-binding subunit n=1 Tax=Aestuariivirga sp. TaxID=2650926 RepID=UPI0025C0A46D|nr:molybdopterin cofactor-binding domain-containing protein [Aestuariivirga sp.]MCA3556431.1 xanthine dehydrogenase family protein molybdopterin-binding subunit [Aestuariivirga sp.]